MFLGQFFLWDPRATAAVARAHGFESRDSGPKTGIYDDADIDDDFIAIHHYLKWFKFGFTRTFDNLSLEIRNGRLTRERALETIRDRGDDTPWSDIAKFCEYVGMSQNRFFEIAESFRNLDIWSQDGDVWTLDGFLLPDWPWELDDQSQ